MERPCPPFAGWAPLPALLMAMACASQPPRPALAPPPSPPPAPAQVRLLAQVAADQVRRCYRKPRVSSEAAQIVTRIRVRFLPDGQLAALPQLVSQQNVTPSARPFASRMMEAASLAVIRCAPVRLPPESYAGGWDELEFTFSPPARG